MPGIIPGCKRQSDLNSESEISGLIAGILAWGVVPSEDVYARPWHTAHRKNWVRCWGNELCLNPYLGKMMVLRSDLHKTRSARLGAELGDPLGASLRNHKGPTLRAELGPTTLSGVEVGLGFIDPEVGSPLGIDDWQSELVPKKARSLAQPLGCCLELGLALMRLGLK